MRKITVGLAAVVVGAAMSAGGLAGAFSFHGRFAASVQAG